ncbi:hypothetical protein O6H91_02G096300 [Diphasiastrum complanatum]|uniref:Uncharacterized protein n=1 Tax=Diphasiastrum complanatum TaxID=34168 RepID=A0ACC2EIR7_DIPCM|nr:hypothetical protein O6H91_02G096300 [Diphasiastrum complanatum]
MRGSISSRGTTAQTAEETSQVRAVRNAPGTKKYHDSPTSVLEDPGGAWPENSNTSSRSIWSSSSSEALLSPKSEDESAESDRDTSEYSDSDHEDCKPTKKLKTQEGQKKLSRNKNPGRRIIGGRVYDSVLGETCHWCRQKTVEDHVACCNCSIKFCGLCLRNRHGENIDDERRKSVQWVCPKCRGGCGPGCSNCCNCGPCRKAQGLPPTGQMVREARAAGYSNVHDFLIFQKTGERAETISLRKVGRNWTKGSNGISKCHKIPNPSIGICQKSGSCNVQTKVESQLEALSQTSTVRMRGATTNPSQRNKLSDSSALCSPATTPPSSPMHHYVQAKVKIEVNETFTSKTSSTDIASPKFAVPGVKASADVGSESFLEDSVDSTSLVDGGDRVDSSSAADVPAGDSGKTEKLDASLEKIIERSVLRGLKEATNFTEKLNSVLDEPFDMHQLAEMWELANHRKPVIRRRETRHRSHEISTSEEGLSYLDHHPDLALKLASTMKPEGKLRLLRGFFCWLKCACMPGAFKPWADSHRAFEDEDCLETDGPDCEIIAVVLSLDEDETAESLLNQRSGLAFFEETDVKPKQNLDLTFNTREDGDEYVKRKLNAQPTCDSEDDVKPCIYQDLSPIAQQVSVKGDAEQPNFSLSSLHTCQQHDLQVCYQDDVKSSQEICPAKLPGENGDAKVKPSTQSSYGSEDDVKPYIHQDLAPIAQQVSVKGDADQPNFSLSSLHTCQQHDLQVCYQDDVKSSQEICPAKLPGENGDAKVKPSTQSSYGSEDDVKPYIHQDLATGEIQSLIIQR